VRLLRTLALAAVAFLATGCPSCKDICRNDLDCEPDEGTFKCVGNVCQPTLPEETGAVCTADADCTAIDSHLRCIDTACEFGPSCQFVADATALKALVKVGADEDVYSAVVARSGAGCAFDIEINGAGPDGGTETIAISSIDVDTGAMEATGCDRGRWTSSGPGGYLVGCGAADIDYVFGTPGSTLCFAPGGACPTDTTCNFMTGFSGTDEGGFCE
jgi:hypothetical protein